MSAEYRISPGFFDRWVILHPVDAGRAWSGMRWVPVNGTVQICNFGTKEEAEAYAQEVIVQKERNT